MSLNYTNLPSKLIAELIGTFILVYVILVVTSNKNNIAQNCAIPIAIAIAVSIYMFGDLSGCHINPVVSLIEFFNHKDSVFIVFCLYVVAQCIGGFIAFYWHKNNKILFN